MAMKESPHYEEHYGVGVWVNPTLEAIRHDECLCWNCAKMKPGSDDHCRTAAMLYAVCRLCNVATPVTRCPDWQSK
jgi:hypothetical protein